MDIEILFVDGDAAARRLVAANAKLAADAMTTPSFLTKVRTWPGFDYTNETSAQVAAKLERTEKVSVRVGFYYKPKRALFLPALDIAREQDGLIEFNTAKIAEGAGGAGNIAHEVMHALGYSHRGNSPGPNLNTVPYRIGEWVDAVCGGDNPNEAAPARTPWWRRAARFLRERFHRR